MPNSYKTAFVELNQTTNPTTALRATASTTLVKQVYFSHADHQAVVELYFTDNETGSSAVLVNKVTAPLGEMTPLLNDVMALESGQILSVKDNQSTTGDESYVTVVYVENVTAVNGQSIDVLNDVDTTTALPSTGDVLTWDGNQWEPQAGGGGAVDSVNGQTGVVVLDMDDIDDVDAASPFGGDVLQWTGTAWEPSGKLNLLYSLLKEGTDTSIKNGGDTASELKLESTKATVSTGITKVVLTETSPGDIEFIVATDSSGTTAFTALHIDGLTAANEANIIVKQGAFFKFDDGLYTQWIRPTSGNTGDTVAILPDSSGQLALTTDLYTDSDADARIAAASVTDLTDVSSAGSGAIITSAERTKLSGIATSATANQTDAHLLSRANHTGTQTASTISDFDTEVSNNSDVVANSTKLAGIETGADVTDETNVKAALDGMTLSSATIATGDRLLIQDANASYEQKYVLYDNLALKSYEEDELVSGQNVTMNTGVSVASNKIVDIMGDALADTSNANTKKFLGFHTGSGVCVLKGMVDANNSISGATAGSPLWLGASGSFSATAPTTATYYSRVVGYYIGTLVGGEVMCYFDPSRDWVQID